MNDLTRVGDIFLHSGGTTFSYTVVAIHDDGSIYFISDRGLGSAKNPAYMTRSNWFKWGYSLV